MPDKDELDYRSTESSILAPFAPDPKDVADKGAIKRSLAVLKNRIADFDSIDSLTVKNKEGFSVEQQLAMNKHMKIIMLEVKLELDEAIESLGA
jgi:hypothetical protein